MAQVKKKLQKKGATKGKSRPEHGVRPAVKRGEEARSAGNKRFKLRKKRINFSQGRMRGRAIPECQENPSGPVHRGKKGNLLLRQKNSHTKKRDQLGEKHCFQKRDRNEPHLCGGEDSTREGQEPKRKRNALGAIAKQIKRGSVEGAYQRAE